MSTSSILRQIRRFHVVVVQWTLKKCTKKRDARAELLFWSLNLLFFWSRRCGRRRSCLSSLIKQRRRRRQRERQKTIGLDNKTTNMHLHHLFSQISLPSYCSTTTWKCLNSRFVEDGNTWHQLSFSFPELWYSPLEFNSKRKCQHLTNKWDGISVIKFEAVRIH